MEGFKSPLYILGTGVAPVLITQGRGHGPLPFVVGTTIAVVTQGSGHGPLPFIVGNGTAIPVPPLPGGGGNGLHFASTPKKKHVMLRAQALREDEELIELLVSFITGDII